MKINIIGDIAGRYDELLLLLEKMPKADLVLSVGDMIDRGPKSKEVLEWFIKNEGAEALYGNHEDLFYRGLQGKEFHTWIYNGGVATLESFGLTTEDIVNGKAKEGVPKEILDWLSKRPLYFETDDLFVSHAPRTSPDRLLPGQYDRNTRVADSFIWNRYNPKKPFDKFVINGHNGLFKEHKGGDGKVFGMCIDNSHTGKLMGMHWPTKKLFQQEYLDLDKNASYYRLDRSGVDS